MFCSYGIHWTGMLQIVFLVSLESSWQGGVHGIGSTTFGPAVQFKVLEYWMISSLKIKLNSSWKFQRYWNVPLVLLDRSWWAGFNGIYLVKLGFRMWDILILKWVLPLKIQINSKKPGFERKNQLRMWYHLKAYHSIQAWFPFIFGCWKNRYIHCKTMFTCWVSLFCNGFTLGPTAQVTLVYIKR